MALPVPDPAGGVFAGAAGIVGAVGAAVKQTTAAGVSIVPGVDQLGGVIDAVRAVRAWSADRHNWVRVAWFLSGSVMFTVGAVMVGERPVASAAAGVVKPVGRVVKSAYKG